MNFSWHGYILSFRRESDEALLTSPRLSIRRLNYSGCILFGAPLNFRKRSPHSIVFKAKPTCDTCFGNKCAKAPPFYFRRDFAITKRKRGKQTVEVTKALAALRPLYGKDNVEVVTTDGNRIRGIVRSMKTTQALTTPSVKIQRADGEIVKISFSSITEIIDHNPAANNEGMRDENRSQESEARSQNTKAENRF